MEMARYRAESIGSKEGTSEGKIDHSAPVGAVPQTIEANALVFVRIGGVLGCPGRAALHADVAHGAPVGGVSVSISPQLKVAAKRPLNGAARRAHGTVLDNF